MKQLDVYVGLSKFFFLAKSKAKIAKSRTSDVGMGQVCIYVSPPAHALHHLQAYANGGNAP